MSDHFNIANSAYHAAKNMHRQIEDALVVSLKRAGYDDWRSIPNLAQRVTCVIDVSDRWERYYLDDTLLLTVGPLTTDAVADKLTFKRKVRQEIPPC